MRLIVASHRSRTADLVRGACRQHPDAPADIAAVAEPKDLADRLADEGVLLVDWDGKPDLGTAFVQNARSARPELPVVFLCPKAKENTIPTSLRTATTEIIHLPFEADTLVRTVHRAFKAVHEVSPSVNVAFINPFIDATKTVFSTMCSMHIKREKLFLKDDHKMYGDVSGVMGLSGEATGSVVISLPEPLACRVVGNMLHEQPAASLNDDVCDGVGELINMISGHAKSALAKTPYHFTISIPSVVSGPGHEISHRKGTPNIVVLFQADAHRFAIQVCLAPTDDKR